MWQPWPRAGRVSITVSCECMFQLLLPLRSYRHRVLHCPQQYPHFNMSRRTRAPPPSPCSNRLTVAHDPVRYVYLSTTFPPYGQANLRLRIFADPEDTTLSDAAVESV